MNSMRPDISSAFLSFRAENLGDQVFELFTEPAYFPQLLTTHPCLLVGGRGTGKTTTLKSLSYKAYLAKAPGGATAAVLPHVGLYYRVDTNRVRAFDGTMLETDEWSRLFSHYVNLELCDALLEFALAYEAKWGALAIPTSELDEVNVSLHLPTGSGLGESHHQLRLSLLSFEAYINNVGGGVERPALSIQGGPVDALVRVLRNAPSLSGTLFMFLIDEYENLLDYQQRVFNSLIKHSNEGVTYKVGVRDLGFRQRTTLNADELLSHPADYHRIDIVEELRPRFARFAADVCNSRLTTVKAAPSGGIEALFPTMTLEQEATLLGVREVASRIRSHVDAGGWSPDVRAWFAELSDFDVFVLQCRSEAKKAECSVIAQQAVADPVAWRRHRENYGYAYLFALRPGKRGIRKYYAGWDVLCVLSGGNIRYLLELVQRAMMLHEASRQGDTTVSAKHQTEAAQATGRKHLQELEGLSIHGAQLTHLLLSLGRIFQVMAEDPIGHTPEVNQFNVEFDDANRLIADGRIRELLDSAVMHQALVRYPASKLQDRTDIRDYDYSLHPIFAAFFGFSHRRKRKTKLAPELLWALVKEPNSAVGRVLDMQGRAATDELPEQMRLFEGVYAHTT